MHFVSFPSCSTHADFSATAKALGNLVNTDRERNDVNLRMTARSLEDGFYPYITTSHGPAAKVLNSINQIQSQWTRVIFLSMIIYHIHKEGSHSVEPAAVIFNEILLELQSLKKPSSRPHFVPKFLTNAVDDAFSGEYATVLWNIIRPNFETTRKNGWPRGCQDTMRHTPAWSTRR
jgi:hypothetical protein